MNRPKRGGPGQLAPSPAARAVRKSVSPTRRAASETPTQPVRSNSQPQPPRAGSPQRPPSPGVCVGAHDARSAPKPRAKRAAARSPLRESTTSIVSAVSRRSAAVRSQSARPSGLRQSAATVRSASQRSAEKPPARRLPQPRTGAKGGGRTSGGGGAQSGSGGRKRRLQQTCADDWGRPFYSVGDGLSSRTPSPPLVRRSSSPPTRPAQHAAESPVSPGDSSVGHRSTRSGDGAAAHHDPHKHTHPARCSARAVRTGDTMRRIEDDELLLPERGEFPSRYTVVFDLDETLVSHPRPGVVLRRPHLRHLLETLKGVCETVLWTASTEDVGVPVLRVIDPDREFFHHILYRHPRWFKDARGPPHGKDLRLLGRELESVILIENSPNCVRWQKTNAVMVHDFLPTDIQDKTLLYLQRFLSQLLHSGEPVPKYITESTLIEEIRYYRRAPNGKVLTAVAPGVFYYLKKPQRPSK
eukprot:TRINITY_DN2833_c0_g1_i4.p1 TRINITY_DN2833_c0_g1~~TRINITY_DN2833_c0_g1_i4.p1  ORF type:complete len:470 (+),score=30.74 TRINITY_DN2833_c0_g1_i4:89-1498(+)